MSAQLRRIVVCLDVDAGRVKKGVKFQGLTDVGDPVELARGYESQGADELVFLDVSASHEGRATMVGVVRRTAEVLFIPLTVGGGIRSVADMARALSVGADKVAINSAAVANPQLLSEGRDVFGAQCVVCSIDALRDLSMPSGYRVVTYGGRRPTNTDAIAWAKEAAQRGAGEILLTSVDCDGARTGYDVALLRAVSDAVHVPVVASGGAGEAAHLVEAFERGGADAALVAGILHDGTTTVGALKEAVARAGVPVRRSAELRSSGVGNAEAGA